MASCKDRGQTDGHIAVRGIAARGMIRCSANCTLKTSAVMKAMTMVYTMKEREKGSGDNVRVRKREEGSGDNVSVRKGRRAA